MNNEIGDILHAIRLLNEWIAERATSDSREEVKEAQTGLIVVTAFVLGEAQGYEKLDEIIPMLEKMYE